MTREEYQNYHALAMSTISDIEKLLDRVTEYLEMLDPEAVLPSDTQETENGRPA